MSETDIDFLRLNMSAVTAEKETAESRRSELDLLRTLPELLTHHLPARAHMPIYQYYDNRAKKWVTVDVNEMYGRINRWRHAFAAMGLSRGDRVAMLLPNCIEAICFDMAALSNALTPVPLHAVDTPGSSAYIINDSGAKVLVTNKLSKWKAISSAEHTPSLKCVVLTDEAGAIPADSPVRIIDLDAWLTESEGSELPAGPDPDDLAALVYTSGTTGRPKGVMLTHRAIMADICGVLRNIWPEPDDVWFSFLPLSHTFERTTTYYAALGMGCLVGINRSIGLLQEDIRVVRPSVMMSVPRIYEKIYSKVQDKLAGQSRFVRALTQFAVEVGYRRFCRQNGLPVRPAKLGFLDPLLWPMLDKAVCSKIRGIFGDRARIFISGGAAFNSNVAKFFLGCGLNIYQGYGMTETSPVISVNKVGSDYPETVGPAIRNIEVRIGENDELQVKGPTVMKGYWNRPEDTAAMFTEDGWLKTGDQADIYSDGHIRIKGRIKEIIVTSTGEKIPPADLEQAIETDNLFDQAMIVGENKPYIAALVVVNPTHWAALCKELKIDAKDPASLTNKDARTAVLRRIKAATAAFPNYGVPRNVRLLSEPWTIENGLLTPTLKLKRGPIRALFADEIASLYGES